MYTRNLMKFEDIHHHNFNETEKCYCQHFLNSNWNDLLYIVVLYFKKHIQSAFLFFHMPFLVWLQVVVYCLDVVRFLVSIMVFVSLSCLSLWCPCEQLTRKTLRKIGKVSKTLFQIPEKVSLDISKKMKDDWYGNKYSVTVERRKRLKLIEMLASRCRAYLRVRLPATVMDVCDCLYRNRISPLRAWVQNNMQGSQQHLLISYTRLASIPQGSGCSAILFPLFTVDLPETS